FQEPLRKGKPADTAHQIAKINYLNANKTDAFMEALLGRRADLASLPFAMGDACRLKAERSRQFALAVDAVRDSWQSVTGFPEGKGKRVQSAMRRGIERVPPQVRPVDEKPDRPRPIDRKDPDTGAPSERSGDPVIEAPPDIPLNTRQAA